MGNKKIGNNKKKTIIFSSVGCLILLSGLFFSQNSRENTKSIIDSQFKGITNTSRQVLGKEAHRPNEPEKDKTQAKELEDEKRENNEKNDRKDKRNGYKDKQWFDYGYFGNSDDESYYFNEENESDASETDSDSEANSFEKKIFDLINEDRRKNGQNELEWSDKLAESAEMKAKEMSEQDYFDHTSPSGESPWENIKEAGYDFSYVGENLAFNYSSPEQTHQGLMDSDSHRENILSSDYTEVGIAAIKGDIDGREGYIVVEHFGRQR